MIRFVYTAIVVLFTMAATEAYLQADSRVRTSSPELVVLLREGVEGSPTFQRLIKSIDATDGLVYIEPGHCGVNGIHACLVHRVTVAGPSRILRILVDVRRPDSNLTGAIAHELQHAVEVLGNPTITTDLAITRFYFHRGVYVNGVYETHAAIDVGNAVQDEIVALRARSAAKN